LLIHTMLITSLLTSTLLTVTAAAASWNVDELFKPSSEVPNEKELGKCVDSAADLLGIDMGMRTDPALILDILGNDMHLQDMLDVVRMMSVDLKQPQPLGPMLEKIRKGITSVHPAVGTFLCVALSNTETVSVFSAPNAALIKRTVHHMYLLDKIVKRLADDRVFMAKVIKHIRDTVSSMTPHKSRLGHIYDLFKAAGLFGVMKSFSINGAVDDYEMFRSLGFITPEEEESRKRGLTTNVLEATATDIFHWRFSNAWVGYELSRLHPSKIEISGEDREVHYVNNMNYARLYETWNLAFITGNLDFPNFTYPKLLIPSVILADANTYLYNRVLALWLTINIYLMADLSGKQHVTYQGQDKIADLWGKLNVRYTEYLKAQ